ncbi:dual specificity protein phosphatase family protein [Streptomyces sp. NPDC018693]|uniref:fused DSP-PTPase phosphatase/NAD kinase-like protein n=1 Tax=unclassified Streptomyces TaxID=2593676 RepID=UPI0037A5D51E
MAVTASPSPTSSPTPPSTLAPAPAATRRPRSVRRRVVRVLLITVIGYLALWATGTFGILAASYWARGETPPPPGTHAVQGIHHFQPVDSDGQLWRGAAPSPAGYQTLDELGFSTVVDLRAEKLTAAQLAAPEKAGLDVVRMPIRDGQTPTPEQVKRFQEVVANASGPVFVHCGAGVGRTGAVVASYLVQTGEESPTSAVRRNLAVGPPSVEQIYYALSLDRQEAKQPPPAVVAVSRLVDAPRRIWSYF